MSLFKKTHSKSNCHRPTADKLCQDLVFRFGPKRRKQWQIVTRVICWLTNNAFQITNLCLCSVHGYAFTDMSEGGTQRCLAFFQGTVKRSGRHWKIGVNLWRLQAGKNSVVRICYCMFLVIQITTGDTETQSWRCVSTVEVYLKFKYRMAYEISYHFIIPLKL